MQQLVVDKAGKLFCNYGFRAVAMDDIARELGISKKTLYQFFADKEALVADVVQKLVNTHVSNVKALEDDSRNVVEEVFREFELCVAALHSIQPVFFYELERQFPVCWKQLDHLNTNICLPSIINNLTKGIAQGYYRQDLDVNMTAVIRLMQLKLMVTRSLGDPASASLLHQPEQINLFYLHAITNPKGKKLMDNYLKKQNETHRTPSDEEQMRNASTPAKQKKTKN